MLELPLSVIDGHLFVELEGQYWLFDTGAPTSFGKANIKLADEQFSISNNYMGLTPEQLSGFVGVPCFGLLGGDVLEHFDHVIDCTKGCIKITKDEVVHSGQAVHLSEFMGIPIITAHISGTKYRMFFDTGAQISYFQDDSLVSFPACGSVKDFYPGVGQFETETFQVEVSLADSVFSLRCGSLPGLLGATLMMADTQGIIGNQIMANRTVGYFPRRNLLCL